MTDLEIFDSTDPLINETDVYQYTAAANLYHVLGVIALDLFGDRYSTFFLPSSFTLKGKKSLQIVLDNYQYVYDRDNNRPFLVSVFNQYEADHGKVATVELLDWMRNVTDSAAKSIASYLSYIHHDLTRGKKIVSIPPRVERYFAHRELLRDQYFQTTMTQDLDPSYFDTRWDKAFYAKHEHDYYGDVENTWDPSDIAAMFVKTIQSKVAWENACQGSKPNEDELRVIGDWIIEHNDHLAAKDYENPASLFVSPILRAEYVRRGLILD